MSYYFSLWKKILFLLLCCSTVFSTWAQTQKGIDIDGEAVNDESGYSVSMPNASTVAIGAYRNDGSGSDAGHVRIYTWNGSAWIQKGSDIDGEAGGDQFGYSVSMPNANTVAIGAPFNDGSTGNSSDNRGHVRIYTWNGSAWTQKGSDIDGEAATDRSGWSVSMPDANTVTIGAPENRNTALGPFAGADAGHVRIYRWNGSAWVRKGSDIDGEGTLYYSGYSVSMPDANTIAVGAIGDDGNSGNSFDERGHVRIYRWNGMAWVQKGSDIDGEAPFDNSGYSVSMPNANTVAIGAPFNDGSTGNSSDDRGHVRIYRWNGIAWVQKGSDIDGEAVGDNAGHSVSMPDINTVAIGAPFNDGSGSAAGHVRIYEYVSGAWTQKDSDINGETGGDNAGHSVSMPDTYTVAIGATKNDGNGSNAGHVRIYGLPVPSSEIDITGNGSNISDGQTAISTTDATDFGGACVTGGTVTRTFTINNTGTIALSITSIVSSDPRFMISGAPSSVGPSGSATFDVTFDPSSQTTFTSTITIDNNDPDENPFTFAVEGIGSIADQVRGDALDFDGTNDFVEASSLNLGLSDYTLEAWIKPDAIIFSQMVLATDLSGDAINQLGLQLGSNNNFQFVDFRGGAITIIAPADILTVGEWAHLAVVRSSVTNYKLYLNGVEVASKVATGTPGSIANPHPLRIGARGTAAAQNPYDGQIDEVRIWHVARTATQIRENMHLTLSGCETGLVSYYQLNEGTGSTVAADAVGGNNGTLNNMDPATDWVGSGLNVGNDGLFASNSVTVANVFTGASTQSFAAANLSIDFVENDAVEDFTVTYQAFTPNATTGTNGVRVFDNPTWTINKATATSNQNFNLTFTLPAGTYPTDGSKYRLLWRPMYSHKAWAVVKGQAASVSGTAITFENLFETGQYMVEQFSAAQVSDVRGNMYELDGNDDFIAVPNSAEFEFANGTVEFWVKPEFTSRPYNPVLVCNRNGSPTRWSYHMGNLRQRLFIWNGSNVGIWYYTFNQNEWYHIAFVESGFNTEAFVNGISLGVQTITSSSITGLPVNIGSNGSAEFFSGKIEELRIWNAARTQDQIRENMHLTLKGNETGLGAYYQFNNDLAVGTPGGVRDAVNGNHGTTVNMTTANYIPSEVAVAGGVSDLQAVNSTGVQQFTNTGVAINFTTAPATEVAVYRLQTEPPTGISAINVGYNLDDQYYVIRRFGGSAPDISHTDFSGIGYVAPADVANPTAFELYKRPSNAYLGSDWALANAAGANGTASNAGPAAAVGFAVTYTDFSQFVILNSSGNSILPTELLDFQAQRITHSQVDLNWSTATEINASHFEVERMLDNTEVFTKVGEVTAAGHSNSFQSYVFQDANAHQGLSYYRLKQVDEDGSVEYSEIRAVAAKELGMRVTVFPNPVDDILKLRLSNITEQQQMDILIFNHLGQLIYEGRRIVVPAEVVELGEVGDLIPGSYYLQLRWEEEGVVRPFVKQ